MSTKTTFKRIALVAVAALGAGVLSVAPSQAASTVQGTSVVLGTSTTSIKAGETATANAAVNFTALTAGESVTVQAVLTTFPTGGSAAKVRISTVDSTTNTAVAYASGTLSESDGGTTTKVTLGAKAVGPVAATITASLVSAPVAGTYVVGLFTTSISAAAPGVADAAAPTAPVYITFTVAAAAAPDATSTAYIAKGAATPASADSATITASNTVVGSVVVARIVVTQNVAGVAATYPESLTATVSGAGTLVTQSGAVGRSLTVKYTDYIDVKADGSSGLSTITITGATSGRVYGTKTLTFYGDVASATAVAVKPILNATSGNKAVLVTLKDSAGTVVSSDQTFYVTSSDVTKVSGNYSTTGTISYADKNYAADGVTNLGAGYLINLTGVAAGTASITVGTKSSATATTGVNAAPVSVRVGSETAASVKVSLDKTSYAPGEKATLTVALFDATGLPVADKTYTNVFSSTGIVAGYTLGAASDSITGTSAITDNGVAEYTIYMPMSEKDVTFKWTTGTGLALANQAVAGSVTAGITSSAIEAANAATTAALAANDAVDALAATVAKLVANLKAQITALTKLIVKIQKKVGA